MFFFCDFSGARRRRTPRGQIESEGGASERSRSETRLSTQSSDRRTPSSVRRRARPEDVEDKKKATKVLARRLEAVYGTDLARGFFSSSRQVRNVGPTTYNCRPNHLYRSATTPSPRWPGRCRRSACAAPRRGRRRRGAARSRSCAALRGPTTYNCRPDHL